MPPTGSERSESPNTRRSPSVSSAGAGPRGRRGGAGVGQDGRPGKAGVTRLRPRAATLHVLDARDSADTSSVGSNPKPQQRPMAGTAGHRQVVSLAGRPGAKPHGARPNLERSSVGSAGGRLEASHGHHGRSGGGQRRLQQLRQAASDDEDGERRRSRLKHQGHRANVQQAANGRKVGPNAKLLTTWVRIWPSGDSSLLQTEKATLTHALGIQARDFRIIESQTSRQACCILCREKCIIVSMAYIRCVITSQYILMTPPEDDRSAVFLGKLKERVHALHLSLGRHAQAMFGEAASHAAAKRPSTASSTGGVITASASAASAAAAVAVAMGPLQPAPPLPPAPGAAAPARKQWSLRHIVATSSASASASASGSGAGAGGGGGTGPRPPPGFRALQMVPQLSLPLPLLPPPPPPALFTQHAHQDEEDGLPAMEMPFELKVLEICLDELANDIENGTCELETSLKPAIDGLANSVRSENLDLLRRLKTRLVTLKSLTQTVCDTLEELLEDDDDMFNMSLSAKEQRELDLLQRVSFAISEGSEEGHISDGSCSSHHSVKVSQVEMLLETYFMHFDSMFDRLQDLMENVTDTEAVVNIKLDAQQNRLIAVNIVSQGLSVINYFAIGVFGFFTMNLLPPFPINMHWGGGGSVPASGGAPDLVHFIMVMLPAILGAYCLFVSVVVFLYMRGIVQF